MLWPRLLPLVIAVLLAGACTSSSGRHESPLPDLPRVATTSFQPRIREQVQKAYDDAQTKPKDPDAAGRLGMLLHAYEQYESAEICYRRARILSPDRFQWAYYLGLIQSIDGKNDAAAVTLQEAVRLDPEYLPARMKLAEVLLGLNRLGESQDVCRLAARPVRPGLLLAGTRCGGARRSELRHRKLSYGLPTGPPASDRRTMLLR